MTLSVLVFVVSFVAANFPLVKSINDAAQKGSSHVSALPDIIALFKVQEIKSWLEPVIWAEKVMASDETNLKFAITMAWKLHDKVKALDALFPGSVTQTNYDEMLVLLENMTEENSDDALYVKEFKTQDNPNNSAVKGLVYYNSHWTSLVEERSAKIFELKEFCQKLKVSFEALIKHMNDDQTLARLVAGFLVTSDAKAAKNKIVKHLKENKILKKK